MFGLGMLLSGVWLVLMLRACRAEYRYYACVASETPDVWQELGSPRLRWAPFLLWVSPSGKRRLSAIDNAQVRQCAAAYRRTGRQFLCYVVMVLVMATAYFHWA